MGAAALHPGLHSRAREAELGSRARLREPLHFGERERIPLERRQPLQHRLDKGERIRLQSMHMRNLPMRLG